MSLEVILLIVCTGLLVALICIGLAILKKTADRRETEKQLDGLMDEIEDSQRKLRAELLDGTQKSVNALGLMLRETQKATGETQDKSLLNVQRSVVAMGEAIEKRLATSAMESEQKLENIRQTMEKRIAAMQEDNAQKLEKMRETVDEKLQKTIEARMTESFKLVNDRLEQVYRGLGEMQTLAVGVGDLKRVLSNVKTRGTLGEIQLGAILSEIMPPEQYDCNVVTVKNSRSPVEYAIKLPGEDENSRVYLPIDSKFPMDAYAALVDAYEAGEAEAVKAAQAALCQRIRGFAKDIHEKYVSPPETTEFAIMFLPTEGLYAEAVRLGMLEKLQHEFRVSIAGPSTMAALLNSLQMGFRTVAIQKRSGEVWNVLGAVKTEFSKFSEILEKAQKKILMANSDLDTLIGKRTRAITRSLKDVATLSQTDAAAYLPSSAGADEEAEDGNE